MAVCCCEQFERSLQSFSEVRERCNSASELSMTLEKLATAPEKWMEVYRCRECKCFWAKEFPFSESHGGGMPCFYKVSPDDPIAWLATAQPLTNVLRQRAVDLEFLSSLGPEVGPALCRKTGCSRKCIRLSVFCLSHHFEMITRRSVPSEKC